MTSCIVVMKRSTPCSGFPCPALCCCHTFCCSLIVILPMLLQCLHCKGGGVVMTARVCTSPSSHKHAIVDKLMTLHLGLNGILTQLNFGHSACVEEGSSSPVLINLHMDMFANNFIVFTYHSCIAEHMLQTKALPDVACLTQLCTHRCMCWHAKE